MSLTQKIPSMMRHPMLGQLFKKLTVEERKSVNQFIVDNEHLGKAVFHHNANRWYVDVPKKPRHMTDMWAIVTQIWDFEEKSK